MKVSLTEIEVSIAKIAAKMLNDYSIQNGYSTVKKRDGRPDLELHIEGFGYELAVAKALNAYPDFSSDYSKVDLYWKGRTINVKGTKYSSGRLLVPDFQGKTADWYILVTGQIPEYQIRGVAHADDIFKKENIGDLGRGKSYMLNQNQLRDFEGWMNA